MSNSNLKIGQKWYVKLPCSPSISDRQIVDLTKETVLLLEINGTPTVKHRYKISDLEFVELINKEDNYANALDCIELLNP